MVNPSWNDNSDDDDCNSWAEEAYLYDDDDEDEDDDDDYDDYYGEEDEDNIKKKSRKVKKVKVQNKIVINVFCSDYYVVKKTAKMVCGFKLVEIAEDNEGSIWRRKRRLSGNKLSQKWDITWHDLPITPDFFAKLEPY